MVFVCSEVLVKVLDLFLIVTLVYVLAGRCICNINYYLCNVIQVCYVLKLCI